MHPSVFITQPVAKSATERLLSVADVEWNPDAEHTLTKDELCAAVRQHDILFCLLQDRVDGDVIAANAGLRAVASMKITPSDIDVAAATAHTAYGVCGVKVWVFKGEILGHDPLAQDRLMMEAQTSGVRPAREERNR